MQVSGTCPPLSDNTKKTIKKPVSTRSATALQRGGALTREKPRHAGSLAGNRDRAHKRAGRE